MVCIIFKLTRLQILSYTGFHANKQTGQTYRTLLNVNNSLCLLKTCLNCVTLKRENNNKKMSLWKILRKCLIFAEFEPNPFYSLLPQSLQFMVFSYTTYTIFQFWLSNIFLKKLDLDLFLLRRYCFYNRIIDLRMFHIFSSQLFWVFMTSCRNSLCMTHFLFTFVDRSVTV